MKKLHKNPSEETAFRFRRAFFGKSPRICLAIAAGVAILGIAYAAVHLVGPTVLLAEHLVGPTSPLADYWPHIPLAEHLVGPTSPLV